MKIFEEARILLQEYLDSKKDKITTFNYDENINWEKNEKPNPIMEMDSAIDFGHHSKGSAYYIIFTNDDNKVVDGRITVVGNDIPDIKGNKSALGQFIIIKGHDFNERNISERYNELDILKRHTNLNGYMFRAKPQKGEEWVRLSKEALKKGISYKIVGSEMIKKFREKDYIDQIEIVFVTENNNNELTNFKFKAEDLCTYIEKHDMNEANRILGQMEEFKKSK